MWPREGPDLDASAESAEETGDSGMPLRYPSPTQRKVIGIYIQAKYTYIL